MTINSKKIIKNLRTIADEVQTNLLSDGWKKNSDTAYIKFENTAIISATPKVQTIELNVYTHLEYYNIDLNNLAYYFSLYSINRNQKNDVKLPISRHLFGTGVCPLFATGEDYIYDGIDIDRYVKHIKDQAYLMYEKYNNIDNIIKLYDNQEVLIQYLVMNMYTKNYKKVCDMIKSSDVEHLLKSNIQVGIEAYLKNHELC